MVCPNCKEGWEMQYSWSVMEPAWMGVRRDSGREVAICTTVVKSRNLSVKQSVFL